MKGIRTVIVLLVALSAAGCAFATGGSSGSSSGGGEGVDRIHPEGAQTMAPYTPAVRANGFVFFSGQIGIRRGAGLANGVGAQTEQALANMETLMRAAGVRRARRQTAAPR